MNITNCKRLTDTDRCNIDLLDSLGMSTEQIASITGFSRSTVNYVKQCVHSVRVEDWDKVRELSNIVGCNIRWALDYCKKQLPPVVDCEVVQSDTQCICNDEIISRLSGIESLLSQILSVLE